MEVEEKIAGFWHDADAVEGASSVELAEAEARLGFRLPSELKELLRRRNGGIARYDLIGEILLAPIRGVGSNARTADLVALHFRGGIENLPKNVVIFAADSNAWFGLDYRASRDSPRVLHWSEYEDEPVQLARTFRDFLGMLHAG